MIFQFIVNDWETQVFLGEFRLSMNHIELLKVRSSSFNTFLQTGISQEITEYASDVISELFDFLEKSTFDHSSFVWKHLLCMLCSLAHEIGWDTFDNEVISSAFINSDDLNLCNLFHLNPNEEKYGNLGLKLLKSFLWNRIYIIKEHYYMFIYSNSFETYPFCINSPNDAELLFEKIYWCLIKCMDPKFGNVRLNLLYTMNLNLFGDCTHFQLYNDENCVTLLNQDAIVIRFNPYESYEDVSIKLPNLQEELLKIVTNNINVSKCCQLMNDESVVFKYVLKNLSDLIHSKEFIGREIFFIEKYMSVLLEKFVSEKEMCKSLFRTHMFRYINTKYKLLYFLKSPEYPNIQKLITKFVWKHTIQSLDGTFYFIKESFSNSVVNYDQYVDVRDDGFQGIVSNKTENFNFINIWHMCLCHALNLRNCSVTLDSRFKLALKLLTSKSVDIICGRKSELSKNGLKIFLEIQPNENSF